jgi:hypothetical protein
VCGGKRIKTTAAIGFIESIKTKPWRVLGERLPLSSTLRGSSLTAHHDVLIIAHARDQEHHIVARVVLIAFQRASARCDTQHAQNVHGAAPCAGVIVAVVVIVIAVVGRLPKQAAATPALTPHTESVCIAACSTGQRDARVVTWHG